MRLSELIQTFSIKFKHTPHLISVFKDSLSKMAYKLMERCIKKSKSDVLESAYDPEIRMFAINLHFYSAKAYNYVRSILHDALPCERTLRLWTNKILSTPGFCERSFFLLKMKKEEMEAESKGKLIVSLILDEITLKNIYILTEKK